MINKLTWPYIAGFFDGEGSVRHSSMKYSGSMRLPAAHITQAIRKDEILKIIMVFLKDNGIKCSLYKRPKSKKHTNWKQVNRLQVFTIRSARKFYGKIYPYLIVKRKEVGDQIRYIDGRTWNREQVTVERFEAAVKDYLKGFSFRQIEMMHKIHTCSMRTYMKRKGYRPRTRQGGLDLWKKKHYSIGHFHLGSGKQNRPASSSHKYRRD